MLTTNTTPLGPIEADEQVASATPALLAELQEIVVRPAEIPKAGADAAEDMFNLFSDAAHRIRALAQEGVTRALEIEKVAETAAKNLEVIGDNMKTQIELESARARQVGLMMQQAGDIIAAHGLPVSNA